MNYAGKRVEIIDSDDECELAQCVNKFLASHENVLEIKFQVAISHYRSDHFVAMIVYEN